MNPKRRRRKRHGSARRLADEAWEALARGEIDLAVRIAGRAIARAADSPPAWTDYARLLTEAGDLAKAERAARNAILIGPSDPEAWVALSEILARKGLSIEACRAAYRASTLRPQVALYQELLERRIAELPPDFRSDPALLAPPDDPE